MQARVRGLCSGHSQPSLNPLTSERQPCHGGGEELRPSHGQLGCFKMLCGSWDTQDQAFDGSLALHHQVSKQVKYITGWFSHRRRWTSHPKSAADSDACLILSSFKPRAPQTLLMFYVERINQMYTSCINQMYNFGGNCLPSSVVTPKVILDLRDKIN